MCTLYAGVILWKWLSYVLSPWVARKSLTLGWHGVTVSPAPRLCLFGEGASLNCSETAKVLWVDVFFFFSGDSLTKTHQFGVNPPAILVALICPISCWTYRSTNPEPKKTWWLARRFWKNQTFGTLKDFPKSFRFICEDKAWCCFLCRRFIFCCIFFCEDHLLFFLRASH